MDDEPNRLPIFPRIGCKHERTGDPGCGLERRGHGWTCVEGRACGRHFDDPEVVARIDEYDAEMLGLGEAEPLDQDDDHDSSMLDDDDVAVWEVLRDGTSTPTAIAGYTTGDQRGLVALHFAQDDEAGWLNGQYNEFLWVRRCKPDPEREPGQAIRVTVVRDNDAERGWAEDEQGDEPSGSDR